MRLQNDSIEAILLLIECNWSYVFSRGVIMKEEHKNVGDEISDLKRELEHFQREKERVRQIIGKIGGVPKFRTKLINGLFLLVIGASVVLSVFGGRELQLLMIEVATIALSLKIIYLIHCQMRVNHFQFWILSSLEWRLNELMRTIRKTGEKQSGGSGS